MRTGREQPEAPLRQALLSQASIQLRGGAEETSWGTGPVLSSVLACLSPIGARARPQVNKMWQETMNQGDEGIKEVGLTSGSKSLSFSFRACSSLSLPSRVRRLPPALPFESHPELGDGRENPGLAWHALERQDLGPILIATGSVFFL